MKLLPLLAIAALLTGCSTTLYEGGVPIAKIQGDATNVTLKTARTYFHADTLNHSRPTTAGGAATAKVIGSVGTSGAGIITALATNGIAR